MKPIFWFLSYILLPLNIPLWSSGTGGLVLTEMELVASTPGDPFIKSVLTIPQQTSVDFIRWELTLQYDVTASGTFTLNIHYGTGKQGTPDFNKGGSTLTLNGTFVLLAEKKQQVYRLNSEKNTVITFIKINENIYQLLTPDGRLLVGNGGWSYSLNRKIPLETKSKLFPVINPDVVLNDPEQKLIFEGRTPCQEFSAEHREWHATGSCNKLKWRLVLKKDPVSKLPTTYSLKKVVDNEARDQSGTWSIIEGTVSNPDIIIYELDPDKPGQSISFLVADENILFFLKRDKTLLSGNKDFSYTLNRAKGS